MVELFSYPNQPGSTEPLAEAIEHWLNQMLARDGFAAKGAVASVRYETVVNRSVRIVLQGPDEMLAYVERLNTFFDIGIDAHILIETKIKPGKPNPPWPDWVVPPLKNTLWDPMGRGTWRFFLPLGMAMVNQRMVNFFHYPPMPGLRRSLSDERKSQVHLSISARTCW